MVNLAGRDIISIKDFTREELEHPFKLSEEFRETVEKHQKLDLLEGYVLCSLFYEPSTRTRLSFESAMQRLGGANLTVAQATKTTSAAKGESLADAIRVMEMFADVVLLRHPEKGAAQVAADAATVPLISGGDGGGEHPVQAFSELYTINREKGRIDGLEITFLGDLKHARTMRSLALGLSRFDVRVNFVAPKGLEMEPDVTSEFQPGQVNETDTLDEVLGTTDILYIARVQAERFASKEEYEAVKGSYQIDMTVVERAKKGLTIMHPLPRLDELAPAVDSYEGAAYFRQSQDLLYNRMALLALVLGIKA
jgi:aspartate carbamoyltransferase